MGVAMPVAENSNMHIIAINAHDRGSERISLVIRPRMTIIFN